MTKAKEIAKAIEREAAKLYAAALAELFEPRPKPPETEPHKLGDVVKKEWQP